MDIIKSKQNPRVKQWKKLHSRKGRNNAGQFLIEGPHLAEEAVKSGAQIVEWIASVDWDVPESWMVNEHSLIIVSNDVMKEISETQTPQGIAAVCKFNIEQESIDKANGKYLLIDGVQDPGNIGTLIRTADSAGLSAIILGKGCADPYNSKVLRSTQGSIFHLPVIQDDLMLWIDALKENDIPVFGTALEHAKSYSSVEPSGRFALIVGNEGKGVDEALLNKTDDNLYIPIYGKAESLNVSVAAGILLYHLTVMH